MTPAALVAESSKKVFIFCDGGFANRVNSLISGMALAELLELDFLVLWPSNNRCGATFDDLFDSSIPNFPWRLQDLVPFEDQLQLWLHENDVGFSAPVTNLRHVVGIDALRTLVDENHRPILFCENTCLSWLPSDLLNKKLKELTFNTFIAEAARSALGGHADNPYIGIHLRGTDFGVPPPVDQMLAAVSGNPQLTFFVCSDDPALESRFLAFTNVFAHNKTAYVNKLADGAWRSDVLDSDGLPYTSNIDRNAQSVAQACVDLLLLAASEPYPTSSSSFLALAARMRSSGFVDRHLRRVPPASKSGLNTMNPSADTASETPDAALVEPSFTSQEEILNLLNLIRPLHLVSDHKVRIGSNGDGGYVMPSSSLNSGLVISIGVGGETSFDSELAGRSANVLQFDHTIEQPPAQHPNIRFHRQGWGPRDDAPLLSLRRMMSMADWRTDQHAILKFDTEGAEWDSLAACESSDLDRFEVIAGEFHHFHNLMHRDFFNRVKMVLEKLSLTHSPIHLHANNATGIVLILGISVPPLLEITFMRKRSAVFGGHSNEPIPGPLDRPNMGDRPDLCLRPF